MANYINNKDLLAHLIEYLKECETAKENNLERPEIPIYIAEAIMSIAKRLSSKGNFSGYSWKQDMISDGIYDCLRYVDRFNPEKSQNPFAYFSTICWQAFLRRIAKEKQQSVLKGLLLINHASSFDTLVSDEDAHFLDNNSLLEYSSFVEAAEDFKKKNKKFETEVIEDEELSIFDILGEEDE